MFPLLFTPTPARKRSRILQPLRLSCHTYAGDDYTIGALATKIIYVLESRKLDRESQLSLNINKSTLLLTFASGHHMFTIVSDEATRHTFLCVFYLVLRIFQSKGCKIIQEVGVVDASTSDGIGREN